MHASKPKAKARSIKAHRQSGVAEIVTTSQDNSSSSSHGLGGFYASGPVVSLSQVQAKFTIGRANDPYEREADTVAEHVVSGKPAPHITPVPAAGLGSVAQMAQDREEPEEQTEEQPPQPQLIQRQPEEEPEEQAPPQPQLIQREADDTETEEEPPQTQLIQRQPEEQPEEESIQGKLIQCKHNGEAENSESKFDPDTITSPGGGTALARSVRKRVEPLVGRDLGQVRVHSDSQANSSAKAIQAKAFTHKNHIYLGAGQTQDDLPLMAHEATHVIQQGSAPVKMGSAQNSSQVIQKQQEPAGDSPQSATNELSPEEESTTATQTRATFSGEMVLRSSLRIEAEPLGELDIVLSPRLVHERSVWVRTPSGMEAELTIGAGTEFPWGFDSNVAPEEALHMPGRSSIYWFLNGTLADGTPVNGMGILRGDNTSLAELAEMGPEPIQFGLTDEQQYQAVVNAMRNSVPDDVWEDAEAEGREEVEVEYPSQEEFEQMSREEKRDLAWEKFLEEFSGLNVLKTVLLGLAVVILGLIAVIAAIKGAIVLAIVAAAAAIGLILWGLWGLIETMIHEASERWREGDYLGAILEILKYGALILGMIFAAIVIVASVIAGGVVLVGLGVAALVLFIVAGVIAIIQMFREIDHAEEADQIEDFRRHVQRAAREAEEAVSNFIILIIAVVLGRFAKGLVRGEETRGGEIPGEREPILEGREGVERPGEVIGERGNLIELNRTGGTVEFEGTNGIRLIRTTGESRTGEILTRTAVPEGEVLRIRLIDGQEGEIFVYRNAEGTMGWRLLTPEETAMLGRGEAAIRGTRPRPTPLTEPPRQANGEIDYDAWQVRLRAKGVRGELARKVNEARMGNLDSQSELRTAERYADSGYDVEFVRPPGERVAAEGGPVRGVSSPDLRVSLPGRTPIRVESKFRAGESLTRNFLNSRISEANDQIRTSPEGRGDIVIDAAESPGNQLMVERFLRGKLTGNRFSPDARLSNVEYLEVTYREAGLLKRSYIFRNANGDAVGPFTEILQ